MIRSLLTASAVALLLAACGNRSATSPSNARTATQEASVELTEPWKSMNLPIEGAVVKICDAEFLAVRHVTVPYTANNAVHAAIVEAAVQAGWNVEDTVNVSDTIADTTCTKGDLTLRIGTQVGDGRPETTLTIR